MGNLNTTTAKLAVLLAAVLWSTGGLAVKITNCSPVALTGLRCLSCLVLLLLVYRKTEKLFTFSKVQWAGAIAYCLMAYTYSISTKMTTAANAILLQYTAPIFVALLSGWLLKESVTKKDWLTVAVVMCGVVLFFIDKASAGGMIGNFVALSSGLFYALFIIFTRMQKDTSPIGSVILGNVIALCFSIPSLVETEYTMNVIVGGLYFGLVYSGIAFILYSAAIKSISALSAILIATIEPILNPIWVFLTVGEKPSLFAVVGGIVVIGTLLIRNLYDLKKGQTT